MTTDKDNVEFTEDQNRVWNTVFIVALAAWGIAIWALVATWWRIWG